MSDSNQVVTINSRKFDGEIHRSWQAKLIRRNKNLLEFFGKFEKEVSHEHLGVIGRGTISYEFYWLDCCYNVFRFHEPNGKLRNYYCNINFPPHFENQVLDYIDLDIDVLVWKDFSYQILDLKEFEENAKKFAYSVDLKQAAKNNLENIIRLIESREFPFNYKCPNS